MKPMDSKEVSAEHSGGICDTESTKSDADSESDFLSSQ